MVNKNSKIFIAGHNGMLGSSILRILREKKYKKIITINRNKLDLRDQNSVKNFFKIKKPDVVIIAAAKVGGIKANMNFPANFINDNLNFSVLVIAYLLISVNIKIGINEVFEDYIHNEFYKNVAKWVISVLIIVISFLAIISMLIIRL